MEAFGTSVQSHDASATAGLADSPPAVPVLDNHSKSGSNSSDESDSDSKSTGLVSSLASDADTVCLTSRSNKLASDNSQMPQA